MDEESTETQEESSDTVSELKRINEGNPGMGQTLMMCGNALAMVSRLTADEAIKFMIALGEATKRGASYKDLVNAVDGLADEKVGGTYL